MPARAAGRRFSSSRYCTSKRRPVRDDPGNIISIASSTRYSTPVGPAMTSGGPSMIRSPAPLTWPPEAYTIAPRFSASAWIFWAMRAEAGYGSRLAGSRTISTAAMSPIPRTSPTAGKIGEAAQSHHQVLAHDSGAGDEVVALEVTHHGQAGGGHDRMVAVSEAVMKAAAGVHGLDDTSACHHGSAWYVPTGQALAGREDVGPHARPVLQAEPSSGAAHARHHLVGDEEHAVAVARLSHEPVILGRWNDRSRRGADDRLGDEGGHRVGAFFTDLCVQCLRALE